MGVYRRVVYRSTRMVIEFEMDRKGMREVARGKELRTAVKAIATKGRVYAESISPERTGAYKRSFRINIGHVVVRGMRRVAAILANTDPAAVPIEVGSAAHNGRPGTQPHRVLRRTLAYLGGDPGPRQTLTAPTVGSDAPLQSIPSVAEFRDRQRRRRERDRRHRNRRPRADG